MARRNNVSINLILQNYGERAAQAAQQALLDNAELLAQEAKSRCPVKTGRLRDSIHIEPKRNSVRVVADAKNDSGFCYAPIVEYSPRGQPFMRPAYEAKRIEMINHIQDAIRAAIRQ